MQITTNGGSWTNSAASQQIANGPAGTSKTNNKSENAAAEIQLERSEKAGDRDAQERYEGQPGSNPGSRVNNNETSELEQEDSLLQLPAMEEEPSQLDLRM
jgi:hypothetical protein